MTGRIFDNLLYSWKTPPKLENGFFYLDTDFGKIRVFDTEGDKPVIVNVPDGPNVIEHQLELIRRLSKDYRVVCFEYPGLGFSYPNRDYDYSFSSGAQLLLQVMQMLQLEQVSLLFSCSNGYYAIKAADRDPDRFKHIFLSQTPSIPAIRKWTKKSIPGLLEVPFLGQAVNALYAKKFAEVWYRYALPKNDPSRQEYAQMATSCLSKEGCFCLASLVQGLKKDSHSPLSLKDIPTTLVWGARDFSHRHTQKESVRELVKDCEIIEFSQSGHFPELEQTQDYVRLIHERY